MKTCKRHPKYKGINPPRFACKACWIVYFGICETCVNRGCHQAEIDEAYNYPVSPEVNRNDT